MPSEDLTQEMEWFTSYPDKLAKWQDNPLYVSYGRKLVERVKELERELEETKLYLMAEQVVCQSYKNMVEGHEITECRHGRALRALVNKRAQICDAMCPTRWKSSEPRPHHIVCKLLTRIAAKEHPDE